MAKRKSDTPIKYYEIVDRKGSGFIMDGTKGTVMQQELNCPEVTWIPSSGKTAFENEQGVKEFKDIRYVSGCSVLDPEDQKKRGFLPNKMNDKIPMEKGFMSVERSGNTVALYDYLEKSFYNLDNPDRPKTATAIYREVKMDKKAETLLDDDEMQTRAKSMVYELRLSTGSKDRPYKYDENRIDAMCRMLNVWDETPERQLVLLLNKAMTNPKEFVSIVERTEQTVITEVSHALEMNIIKVDVNVFQYTEENEIILSLGNEKLKPDVKIERFASWLSTEQGNGALTKLRSKLEEAKMKLLS